MTLISYAYAAAAEVVLFFRERETFSWIKLGRDTVVASLAFAYSLWAIWGSGEEWLAKGLMLLLFGIPVFVWLKWRASRAPEPEPALPRPREPLRTVNGTPTHGGPQRKPARVR
jgi:APA family basic amino acid/polyamine antiporter